MNTTRFPLCSRLNVLRHVRGGGIAISTTALHDALGWETYRKFLPYMAHRGNCAVTPESCEKFLRTLNNGGKHGR